MAGGRALADGLYEELEKPGVQVLYDDRDVRPGAMFSDADLLGAPVRVIVSPKNLDQGVVEIVTRDKQITVKAPVAEAAAEVRRVMDTLQKAIDEKVPERL